MLTIAFLATITASCNAQIMKQQKDAEKLEDKKELFIGKPLKKLLKEIGPEIKLVFASGDRTNEAASYMIFRFVDREGEKPYNKARKMPIGVRVMIKEKFEWDKTAKPVSEREKWTREDALKYGNLTIVDIRVHGEEIASQ
jgi:hypothetical protein